ncbi:MAG: class I SAM-dependent methyltransferase, partial [bacterium]
MFDCFLSSVEDPLPDFRGPGHLKVGRGKDHPRYGRWVYAFAKFYKPNIIVEVGTYAGGTAVGWARALKENRKGRLICIDNDTYTAGAYPAMAERNLERVGLYKERFDLKCG